MLHHIAFDKPTIASCAQYITNPKSKEERRKESIKWLRDQAKQKPPSPSK